MAPLRIRELLTVSVGVLVTRTLGSLLGVVVTYVSARVLSLVEAGEFLFCITFSAIACTIARLGLDNYLVRELSAEAATVTSDRAQRILGRTILGVACGAAAVATVVAFVEVVAPEVLPVVTPVQTCALSLAIVAQALGFHFSEALRGLSRPIVAQLVQTVIPSLVFVVAAAIWPTPVGLEHMLMFLGAGYFISGAVAASRILRAVGVPRLPERLGCVVETVAAASSFFWVAVLAAIMIGASVLAVEWLADGDQVAQYTVAYRVVMATGLFFAAINLVITPGLARLYAAGDMSGLQALANRASFLAVVVGLPLAGLVYAAAPHIGALFGSEYVAATTLIRVLVLAQVVNLITGSVVYVLLMTRNEHRVRVNSLLSLGFQIVGLMLLVPKFGALGAAIAFVAASTVENCRAWWLVRRYVGVTVTPRLGALG